MAAYELGPKAHRVTEKYELVSLTAPLFDLDLLKVDFVIEGLAVSGMGLRQVGADMDLHRIATYVDPDLPWQGATDGLNGSVRMIFDDDNVVPFDTGAKALVIHEAVHAGYRRKGLTPAGLREEAACYLAQALFFRLKGDSIVETWAEENPEYFDMPWIDDPYQEDAKARIYVAAEAVIDQHRLDSRRVELSAANVAELTKAIAKDPAYAPHPAKPKPPVKPRRKTLRERLRERRQRRRAQRGR